MTITTERPRAQTGRAEQRFRPEVEWLRAIALLIVVVYHVWLGRVSGGVDVFLLVSAFLLTLSFSERARSGEPFALPRYWVRLFGRLVPPAAIVLLATVAAGAAFFPQIRWVQLIEHAWASLFYVKNWRVISLLKNACRSGAESSARDRQCNERNNAAKDYVLDKAPDAVLTHRTLSYQHDPREGLVPAYEEGIRPFLDGRHRSDGGP